MKYKSFFYCFLSMCVVVIAVYPASAAVSDFDISNSKVSLDQFLSGGPPKDGIPALSNPRFVSVDQSGKTIGPNDFVLGLTINGESKAYPVNIMNWHEIVNDQLGGTSVAVTWCPLTKSAVAFNRNVDGEILEFGVSGLLYKSNVVMYDRNHEGLWSQLNMGGLTGKHANKDLETLPLVLTTWKQWFKEHPDTVVLSQKTGHWRDYGRDPYGDYHNSPSTMFPVDMPDRRLMPKELVIAVKVNDIPMAYPMSLVKDLKNPLEDTIGGTKIKVHSGENGTAYITDEKNDVLPGVILYWFAWKAFYPDSFLYGALN